MKRWPLKKTNFWERIPFFRILLPLAAGIIAYEFSWLPVLPMYLLAAVFFFLLAFIITGSIRKRNQLTDYSSFISLYAFIFLTGWLLCYVYDARNHKDYMGQVQAAAFTARITGTPAEKNKTWKLEVSILNGIYGQAITPATGKAFVYLYKDGRPFPYSKGDTIIVANRFVPVKNAGNPFEFDYDRYCARNNIYQQAFMPVDETTIYSNSNLADHSLPERVHEWCMAQLEHYVKDPATLGLLQAILVGDKINLDSELRQAYANTGIVHIIAISGAHIAVFFLLVVFLFSWIKNKKYAWLRYAVALPLIWFYVLMAGAPPSAVRAATMFSILGIGFSLQKTSNSLNQLLAAAALLLCAQPMWLFAVGFQLSFVAVLSLILFYQPVYRLLSPVSKIARALWGAIAASIAAEILIAPLVIYYFHLFPSMFIVANVAAYLFMGFLMVAGMLIIALSAFPAVAGAIAWVVTFLAGGFNSVVYWLQGFNPPALSVLTLSTIEVVLVYLAITGIAVFLLNKKKPGLYTGIMALCLLILSFCRNEWIALHQEKLVVYNINHVSHVELIKGKRYHVLHSAGSLDKTSRSYSIQPAHIAWHATSEGDTVPANELLMIGNQTVLLLNEPVSDTVAIPVDYLVINHPYKKVVAAELYKTFHPKMMVIGSHYSRSRTAKWQDSCARLGIPLHAKGTDGAFVLESR